MKTLRPWLIATLVVGIFAGLSVIGIMSPFGATLTQAMARTTLPKKPLPSEVAFVRGVQSDLMKRFPTVADAIRAGYFRFTGEDDTGSISYVNLHWTSTDPQHPSQLWYDVKGRLLGADFSVPYVKGSQPKLWGVDPRRWEHFPSHLHYVLADPHAKNPYHGIGVKNFIAAGGSLTDPSAATLVKMGLVKNAAAVEHIFHFPSIWDLEVWVKPNPNGAFANMNPLVKPSKSAGMDDGM